MVKTLNVWERISSTQGEWENDITDDLRLKKINNQTNCIKDRNKWKEVYEKAKAF